MFILFLWHIVTLLNVIKTFHSKVIRKVFALFTTSYRFFFFYCLVVISNKSIKIEK